MITIGICRPCGIGERIEHLMVNGEWVQQPAVIMAESSLEAWVADYRRLFNRSPYEWELRFAAHPDVRFYLVSTD